MSARKRISQTEARALKRRVAKLESQEDRRRNAWARDWPDGVHLGSINASDSDRAKVQTARKLKHAVLCIDANGLLQLYALPLATNS